MLEVLLGFAIGAALGIFAASAWWLARRSRENIALANAQARADSLDDQIQIVRVEAERARDLASQSDRAREAAEKQALSHRKEMESMVRQFEEQKRMLDAAEQKLGAVFKAAGGEALKSNSEQFLTLAKQTFDTLLAQAKGDVEKKHLAIDNLIKPIRDLLEQQSKAVNEIEKKREGAYARIDEQIRAIAASHSELRMETGRLVTALRKPEVRGRWGEMQLRNVVELAGMTAHCDFVEQVTVHGEDGAARPDMLVRVPGGGMLIIDAKVALQAYLDAMQPDADRDACLRNHARQTADHVRKLASRRYWEQFERTPRIVIMFVPLESALSAALEIEPELQSTAMRSNVLIATPISLLGLLRAVAFGWQQEKEAENAREIARTGAELYQRLAGLASAIAGVGEQLAKTTGSYNKMIGTLESRVLPSARRLKEMQSLPEADIPVASSIEIEVRSIIAQELQMLPFAKTAESTENAADAPADEQATAPTTSSS
jgi:DNA recombination protein RmuC